MLSIRSRIRIRQDLVTPIMALYLLVRQYAKEPVYRFGFLPNQSATPDLVRKLPEIGLVRRGWYRNAGSGKDYEPTIFSSVKQRLRKINVSYAHVHSSPTLGSDSRMILLAICFSERCPTAVRKRISV